MLAPMAPHLASEIWESIRDLESEERDIFQQDWPTHDSSLFIYDDKEIGFMVFFSSVQVEKVKGRKRETLSVPHNATQEGEIESIPNSEIVRLAYENPETLKWLKDKTVTKVILAPDGKVINFVLKE